MNPYPKILICGMPRSMTTWIFNIVRQVILKPEIQTLWIASNSSEEKFLISSDKLVLAKCHHFSQKLADAADIIIYSYRDLRTAAVSYHRKFKSPCSREQIETWVEAGKAWLPFSTLVLRYEIIEKQPINSITIIRDLLAEKSSAIEISTLSDEQILDQIEKKFQERQISPVITCDAFKMITPEHRTYQPPFANLSAQEQETYKRVEVDFSDWLTDHDYIQTKDHGQTIDYQLAAAFLTTFKNPTVIDVGVERGSFIELALASGSPRIIGFEPLPRHIHFLKKRFGNTHRVTIYPFAISNQVGIAQLHVATDIEGSELDFYHTLSDLGNSATVIRDSKTLEVQTATLAHLAYKAIIPSEIHFLKIDTDGHDLAVLEGLEDLRPYIIMAEYWDTLPETSGINPYTLKDLTTWAHTHNYSKMIVIRRHGQIETIELDAPWTLEGDWGNVFFTTDTFDFSIIQDLIEVYAQKSHKHLCNYISNLLGECEAKEAEIRHLDRAVQELHVTLKVIEEKEAIIQSLHNSLNISKKEKERLIKSLQEREAVIQSLSQAVDQLKEQH